MARRNKPRHKFRDELRSGLLLERRSVVSRRHKGPLLVAFAAAIAVAAIALAYPLNPSEFSVATAPPTPTERTALSLPKALAPASTATDTSKASAPVASVTATPAPAVVPAPVVAMIAPKHELSATAKFLANAEPQVKPEKTLPDAAAAAKAALPESSAESSAESSEIAIANIANIANGSDNNNRVDPSLEPTVLPQSGWRQTQIKPGDTLSGIFNRLQAQEDDLRALYGLIRSSSDAKTLNKLLPGRVVKMLTGDDGELLELIYQASQLEDVSVKRQAEGSGFSARKVVHEVHTSSAVAAGTVSSSLYLAAKQAGLSDDIIVRLSDLFGWKIDFSQDVSSGDTFTLIYEKKTSRDKHVGDGAILAAEFVNRGKSYRAIGLPDAKGQLEYFTPDGRSLKQAFIRYPVAFNRISSHFQMNRWHPTLRKRRPHRGVDYAAPTGTPVKASGDGRIAHLGRKGGYGKTIIINHGNGYKTLYAHLSRYKKGRRVGSSVLQGEVIGYVGSTGMSTGPHLHYEFLVNGKHQNPVTVDLPGRHIGKTQGPEFASVAERYTAELNLNRPTQLAANND